MNHFCFICKICFPMKKVFSLGRCSISFHLTSFWNFDPLAIAQTLLTSYHKILFPQSLIPYYTGRNCLWKNNIFANEVYCLQIWNICTVKSIRHQKRTFLLCFERTFIYSSPLCYFQKVKQQKNLVQLKMKFLKRIKHLK